MLKSCDFFRKIQGDTDLTSATGGLFTVIACTLALTLGYFSIQDYYKVQYYPYLDLRNDVSDHLPMHIDIIFNKMPCNAISIQFYDELQYSQSNLQKKLVLYNLPQNKNQSQPYIRNPDPQIQRQYLKKSIEEGYRCQIKGILPLPKTPGTLVFKPTALNNIILSLQYETTLRTRMSYHINTLQFGTNNNTIDINVGHKSKNIQNYLKQLQSELKNKQFIQDFHNQTRQLDYFNHLKIIPVSIENEFNSEKQSKMAIDKYRYSLRVGVSQSVQQPISAVMFMTQIEPIHIIYRKINPKIYDLVLELMAIVGGTMATIGLFNSASHFLLSIR